MDGVTESATLRMTVSRASQRALPTLTVAAASGARGSGIVVTGTGFAPGEQVRIGVDAKGAARSITANPVGGISGIAGVPATAGSYDTVTAFGAISAVPAVGSMTVTG